MQGMSATGEVGPPRLECISACVAVSGLREREALGREREVLLVGVASSED